MAKAFETFMAALPPAQLRAEEYYRQIKPVSAENTIQMIATRLSGDVETVRKAVMARLVQGVDAGEIDSEMAEVAKDEFDLHGVEESI